MKYVFVWLAVKLPVGERVSQLLPVQVCSDTEAVALVLVCAVTVRVCVAGTDPLAAAVNVKLEGLRVSGPVESADVTLSVTPTVWVPEDVTMEMVPVQVVPATIPD
ncbi:MAG: hypothetical protein ACLQVN_03280 [Bryobacteraceae bacterium]